MHENIFEQAYPMRNEMENPPVPLRTGGAVQNRELHRCNRLLPSPFQPISCSGSFEWRFLQNKKKRTMPSHAKSADECNALAAVSVGAFCSEIEPFAYEWVGT